MDGYKQKNDKAYQIKAELKEIVHMIMGLELDEIESDKALFSMGFDSLLLLTFGKQITSKYNLTIPLDVFFSELNTLDKITDYINENCPHIDLKGQEEQVFELKEKPIEYIVDDYQVKSVDDKTNLTIQEIKTVSNKGNRNIIDLGLLQKVFDNQFKIISEQNEIIKSIAKKGNLKSNGQSYINDERIPTVTKLVKDDTTDSTKKSGEKDYYVPYHKFEFEEGSLFEELQLKYIKSIEEKYVGLTKNSKENIQKYRDVYANARNSAGFNMLYKEMLYQIIAEKGKGSKIIDIDGNEIVDLTMGFGVNLFGYGADFIKEALLNEIENGMPLGPMGRLPGQVATQISELTGAERVFFCNSGTEADMFALRVARAITGKNKVVCFTGSYHGTYDGVLGLPTYSDDGTISAIPMAPGITDNAVGDLILLTYNSKASLKYIQEHSSEIAAVLVETVQSRRPDLQPKEFLKSLREITEERDIALIFDEVITGFRISAGGAQEHFGIKADIVTYGKVVGGGMPIGVVAGKSKYLDAIDGGVWSFGDNSTPTCSDKKTYAAGTFCHHPMAMAAADAVLKYIKNNKDTMYKELNERANRLISLVNEFFKEEAVPFTAVNFGSLLRFNIGREYEIFYYGLLEKGVYIWEGRNCFISTEHSDEDIEKIINAIKATVYEMKKAGFFRGPDSPDPNDGKKDIRKQLHSDINEVCEQCDNGEEFPMSLIQKRLYSQILITESDPFDIIGAFIINGKADIKRMEKAINEIIKRHEMLRTSMFMENGEFKQKVLSECNITIKEMQQNGDVDLDELITRSITAFDLSKPPLIEVLLIDIKQNEKMIVFHFHHTAADGISMGVFVQEFIALYNGEELKPLKKQYRDFVQWENENLTEEKIKYDRDYWLESLVDVSYKVTMPYDYHKNDVSNYSGETLIDVIDSNTVTELKNLAKKNNASLFMVLLSAFNLMLHKLSGEKNIAVTTPVSSRFDGGFEDCIGMFTNTIALSSHYSQDQTFQNYLESVRNNCLKSYKHLNYPYNMLVNELKAAGENLFNIMFVYENTDSRILKIDDIEIEKHDYFSPTKEFELSVELLEKGGEIGVFWAFRSDLFKTESMEMMINRLKMVIKQIIENPQINTSDLQIITEEEKRQIIDKFNSYDLNYPKDKTIVDLFEEQVEKTPNNIAVVYQKKQLTYKQLNEYANKLAAKLRKLGVKSDDYVAIVAERSIEMIVGIYGILKAGGAYVPIDSSYPSDRIQYTIDDCSAKAVLIFGVEVESAIPVIDLSQMREWDNSGENLEKINNPQDVAYCIYTSGTTGKPKGVMVEHRNIVRLFINDNCKYDFNANDVWMMFHSYCFDFSVWEMYGATLFGGKLIVLSKEDAKDSFKVMEIIKNDGVTVLNQVPSAFYNLLEADSEGNKLKVRYLIFGGEALNPKRLDNWHKWHPEVKIVNMYGITETTVHVTYREIGQNEIEKGISDIGKAIPTLSVYIMNGNSLCGIGMPGELCVAGAGVARGYLNRPELTEERFVDNIFGEGKLYRSGDLARWLPDGNIEYLGRIDEQVKIRGFRIELGEIESSIRKIEFIKDTTVLVRKDSLGENAIYAYFVSNDKVDINEIKEIISKSLPEYMIPAYMMQIDKIPITKNGKLDKKALPEIETKSSQGYVEPKTDTEEIVCKIFSEVLGIEKVGIKDLFFEIGGHSLRATRAMNRIEEETGVKLPIKAIFQCQTAERLSELIDEGKGQDYVQIPKAEVCQYYPMSSVQKRMYLIWQMDKEATSYNMTRCYTLKGHLNYDAVNYAINQLIARHEILRTDFLSIDGELVQNVREKIDISLVVEEDNIKTEEEILGNFVKPFDLENSPLLRVKVVKRNDGHLLMFDLHHIIGDGMSVGIIIKEFMALYNEDQLEQLSLQYKDYSEWMSGKDFSSQKEYWVNQFVDEIPILDIPLDFNRKQEQSFSGGIVKATTGMELKNKIKETAKQTGTTEYMILLSSAMVLLSKYSRQEDIVIGTPISGRTHRDTENMLGMFVNTLAMRGKPEARKTYRGFLEEIKESCFKAYENQEYPFEELVESVDVVRDISRNPLFDVVLALQNNEQVELKLNGIESMYSDINGVIAKFDLTFNIYEENDNYTVELEYCSDLFKKETANTILEHYITIINQLLDDLEIKLSNVQVITKKERDLILNEFNSTYSEFPRTKTIVEVFEELVEKAPDNVAIAYGEEHITYRELNAKANIVAHKLREYGVKPNEFVVIMAERDVQVLIAMFGVLKSGGAYVPIDPGYPEERIEYMINDCKPKVIITNGNTTKTELPVMDIINIDALGKENENPKHVNNPEDIAYVIYTSGTTGNPKGTLIKNKGALRLAINSNYVEFNENTVMLQTGTISFDASTIDIYGTLLNGGSLYLAPQSILAEASQLKKLIDQKHINTMFLTTTLFNQLLESDNSVFDQLDYMLFGGEQATEKYIRTLQEKPRSVKFINAYGPTEVTTISTCYTISGYREKTPIGKPIANTETYVLDGMNLCGIGVPGELCISGEGVAKGYLNKDKLTAERFVDNPYGKGKMYRSGDLVRWLPDGNLEYLGRIDEQVKIRGFRIELNEIENAIRRNGFIKDAIAIVKKDALGDKAIYAYFVSDKEISITEMRQDISRILPEYMIPAYIMQIDLIPVTRNGKLDKKSLPDIESRSEREYIEPKSEIEVVLCNIFSNVLNIEQVGINDSFLELGGDSIKAIRVVSKMREHGYEISFKEIMLKHTVERISSAVLAIDASLYEQSEVIGKVKLTPIIEEFKGWKLEKPHYFNQAVMIRIETVDEVKIKKALNAIVTHHDILRSIYNDDGLEILSSSQSHMYDYKFFDFVGEKDEHYKIEEECVLIQSSIDLENGPLVKVAVFKTDNGNYIMLCIHHLIVDGVSWRILIEDFNFAMEQVDKGQEIVLPEKTASFKAWAEALQEYKQSKQLKSESAYWQNVLQDISYCDINDEIKEATKGYGDIELIFTKEETEKLLYKSNKAFSTEINDLFISAIAIAIRNLTGQNKVCVGLEGHGREMIGEKIDIDRTVGWFTSIYPISVNCTQNIHQCIVSVKEMLRDIPNHGIGYGLLKDVLPEVKWDLCFNYLGHMDAEVEGQEENSYSVGRSSAEENKMVGKISLNGIILGGELRFTITFDKSIYLEKTAEKFADLYKQSLLEIIDFCVGREEVEKTKSDFTSSKMEASEFGEIMDLFS